MELNQRVQTPSVKCILIPSRESNQHVVIRTNQPIHQQQHQMSQNQYQNPVQQRQSYESNQSTNANVTVYRKQPQQHLQRTNSTHQANTSSPTIVDSTMCRFFNDQSAPNNAIENEAVEVERMKSPLQMTSMQHSYQQQKPMQSLQQPVQKPKHQKIIPFTQPVVYRSLNDMKVTELKRELKMRSLAVSGSKPTLIERLRDYESEICTPPDSTNNMFQYTPPSSNSYSSPLSSNHTRSSSGSSPLEEYFETDQSFEPPPKRPTSIISYVQSRDGTLTPCDLDDGVSHQQARVPETANNFATKAPTRKRPTVQKVNDDGKSMGVAKMQYSGSNNVAGMQQSNLRRILTSNTHHSRQQQAHKQQSASPQQQVASYGATAMPTSPFIQKTDNTFHFSQNGSGGEFTLCSSTSNSSEYSEEQKVFQDMKQQQQQQQQKHQQQQQQHQNINNTNIQSRFFNPPIQRSHSLSINGSKPVATESVSLFVPSVASNESCTNSGISSTYQHDQNMMNQQQYANSQMLPQKRMLPPKVQDSPCAADLAGNSPDMPIAENLTYNHDASAIDESVCNNTGMPLDSQTTQKLLSPETLQAHQVMLVGLRQQIDVLSAALGESLKGLHDEQEMIHTAKKYQQELRQKQNKSEMERNCMSFGDIAAMRENNRRNLEHLNKQKQLFTKQKEEHARLEQIEARMVEEIHVGNSIEDIVRLIKQDSRTALLIIRLLHKYRMERDGQTQATDTPAPKEEVVKKEVVAPTKTSKKTAARNNAASERMVSSSDGRMDDIFKTVIGNSSGNVETKTQHAPFSVQQSQSPTSTDQSQGESNGQPDIIEVEDTKSRNNAERQMHNQPICRSISNGNPTAVQVHAQMQNNGQSTSHVGMQNHQGSQQHHETQNHSNTIHHEQTLHHYDQGQNQSQNLNHVHQLNQETCQPQQQQYPFVNMPQTSHQNHIDNSQQNMDQNGAVVNNYGMQPMDQPQNQPQNHHVEENDDPFADIVLGDDSFPDIDAMVQQIKNNDQSNLQNNLGGNFDSNDLDGVFDDDWINVASKNINNQGQYEPGNSSNPANEIEHNGPFVDYSRNIEWMEKAEMNDNPFQ